MEDGGAEGGGVYCEQPDRREVGHFDKPFVSRGLTH